MTRLPALLALLVVLAGCGTRSDDATPDAIDPATEVATTESTQEPTPPTWPPADCAEMSTGNIDYAMDAEGAATLEEAALAGVPGGVTVVRAAKPEPHYQRLWLVLDAAGAVIVARGLFQTEDGGWLVDTEERCSTP